MALFRGIGARPDAVRGTSPIEVRKVLAALFSTTGVLPGGESPLVTGNSTWAYNVKVANFVTSRGVSDGDQLYGNDSVALIGATGVGSTVPIAPGAGLSRIDIAWTRHPTNLENADTSSEPLFGVASGVAASSNPVAPTIPAGALELGRNTMTSAATSTNSAGNTITQSAPVASLRSVVDGVAATPSMRTLGTGAQQAAAGNHNHNTPVSGQRYTAAGSTIDTPGGTGNIAIVYGVTFTAAVWAVANTADGASVVVTTIGATEAGCTVRLFDGATGAPLTSGSRRVNWSATGTVD